MVDMFEGAISFNWSIGKGLREVISERKENKRLHRQ